jgi:hypothetical protein
VPRPSPAAADVDCAVTLQHLYCLFVIWIFCAPRAGTARRPVVAHHAVRGRARRGPRAGRDGPYPGGMIRGGTAALAAAGGLAGLGYYLVVTGKLTIDTGWGRRIRPLGPFGVEVAASAATVFDVITAPYLGRTPRALSGKLQVLDRGTDMVLAEHYTPVHHGRLTAATLETVTFDRPDRVPASARPGTAHHRGVHADRA